MTLRHNVRDQLRNQRTLVGTATLGCWQKICWLFGAETPGQFTTGSAILVKQSKDHHCGKNSSKQKMLTIWTWYYSSEAPLILEMSWRNNYLYTIFITDEVP